MEGRQERLTIPTPRLQVPYPTTVPELSRREVLLSLYRLLFSGSRSHPVAHDGRDLPWQAPGRQIARATTFAFADFVPAVGSFDLHAKMSSMQGGMTGGIDRMEI